MVKIFRISIIFYISMTLLSCGVKKNMPNDIEEEVIFVNEDGTIIETTSPTSYKLSKKEAKKEVFGFRLWNLISFYTQTYDKSPNSVEDLKIYIERMDEESYIYYLPIYKYLKKNKKKLYFYSGIEEVDTNIFRNYSAIYLRQKYNDILLIQSTNSSPCSHIRFARITFFDEDGYYFRSDFLHKEIADKLRDINKIYSNNFVETEDTLRYFGIYLRIVIEYTSNGLINVCDNKEIDLSSSDFFSDIYATLNVFATKNNISRIITPTFMDKNTVYKE